jgi:release factor glutamine methyltransferase
VAGYCTAVSEIAQSLTVEFGPLTIGYDDRVLAPRSWTQLQAQWAGRLLPDLPDGPVLELCSGAGQIGLLAVHATGRSLVAVDANPAACDWIRANAAAHDIDVEVREGDLDAVLDADERYPLVIADPPWVPHEQIGRFPEDPPSAIDGGPDGLDLVRRCLRVIADHLGPSGRALLQLGDGDQVLALSEEIAATGLRVVDQEGEPGRGVVVLLAGSDPR